MNLRKHSIWTAAAASTLAVTLLIGGCSRDHIEAIQLANAGDQAVKLNVGSAVKKYEEATRLDPANYQILWKLSQAYAKQEEWSKVETTLSRAASMEPANADFQYWRGLSFIKLAEAGNKGAYEDAKEPLKKCAEADPNYAECFHLLGEAMLWTGDEQSAVENYQKAIELNPKKGSFYVPLADTYITYKLYQPAEKLLSEGERLLEKVKANENPLYNLYTLLYKVHQSKGDIANGVSVLEKAEQIAGETHPEVAFNLGSAYAVMKPPQTDKAVRLLKSFNKRACKSAAGQAKFKDQCQTSSSLVAKMGGE
ncbi:MAG: hypothetical protein RJA70_2295 [Pseudomonadota bacterium]|jgi:tetratricopeptide (TPR) repeat protein